MVEWKLQKILGRRTSCSTDLSELLGKRDQNVRRCHSLLEQARDQVAAFDLYQTTVVVEADTQATLGIHHLDNAPEAAVQLDLLLQTAHADERADGQHGRRTNAKRRSRAR